jgi:hypothetical protein
MSFEILPNEIRISIFRNVPRKYWVFINEVCKQWHYILKIHGQKNNEKKIGYQFNKFFGYNKKLSQFGIDIRWTSLLDTDKIKIDAFGKQVKDNKCLTFLLDHYTINILEPNDIIEYATKIGYIKLIQVIVNQYPQVNKTSIYHYAAGWGQLNVLEWANKNISHIPKDLCYMASLSNNVEIIEWAIKKGCPMDKEVTRSLVEVENLNLLRWCIERGFPYTKNLLLRRAKSKNNIEMEAYIESLPQCNHKSKYYIPCIFFIFIAIVFLFPP